MTIVSPATTHPIVFFDGVCTLCNTFVDGLVSRDHARALRYASLQGETARALLSTPEFSVDHPSSVVLWENGVVRTRSDAVLRILVLLGSPWSWLAIFRIVPRPIRDAIYDWVARHRYAWFGKRDTCRIPTPEERSLFLD